MLVNPEILTGTNSKGVSLGLVIRISDSGSTSSAGPLGLRRLAVKSLGPISSPLSHISEVVVVTPGNQPIVFYTWVFIS